MKAEEIISKIREIYDFIYEYSKQKENLGEIEIIHSVGDCEGGGDHAEKVFFFKEHNCYIRITGFYSSYHGTDWEYDWTEVFPKEKTITVYE
jgi:hypothetical protein